MGRRLPIEIVNQIKLRLDHNEKISHIATTLKVSRDTIYKVQLNFDLWGQPYAPPSVKLGRPSTLLGYQKLVCFKVIEIAWNLVTKSDNRHYQETP